MKTYTVTGGGGIAIHVVETGNPTGVPIIFFHGTSQCRLQWDRQLNSDLAGRYRLIALDLRGHGLSDKPRDAYGDSKLWADDVHAVIEALDADRPILCGWSYGPFAFLDYIRHYGQERLRGLHFVAALTKLGSEDAASFLTPEFLTVVPQLFSADVETSVEGLNNLLQLCFTKEPSEVELYLMLGYNACVPPHVRQSWFSRSIDNEDLLREIQLPVLITHGSADAIVKTTSLDRHRTLMPHAQVQLIPNAGHAAFWDDAQSFNERLHEFCVSCEAPRSPVSR
jgi:pimeloyl-ACP methyl ester carboxylesterase